jgi:hypothetical protein
MESKQVTVFHMEKYFDEVTGTSQNLFLLYIRGGEVTNSVRPKPKKAKPTLTV